MTKAFFIAALAITLLCAGVRWWARYEDSSLRITFFDVGQGDSALLQWPGGKTWLVDAGGGMPGRDFGERILFPELTRLGVLTLNEAILSHPDRDHGLGFQSLLADLTVERFYFNRRFAGEPGLMRDLRKLALSKGVELEGVAGEAPLGSARLLALEGGEGRNDRTLLLFVEFAGCRVLFTGDMEKAGEAELLRRWPELRADLLKGPHHGSLTSSAPFLLDKLAPRWAVVSAGRGNSYGHPKSRVMERYRERGISVLRTDFHGFLTFRITAEGDIRCESALGPCGEARCVPPVFSPSNVRAPNFIH